MPTPPTTKLNRRQILLTCSVAIGSSLGGCSQISGGSGPCSALKREMELYVNNDYEEAAEFVPYRKMPKVSKEEAVKWQMLQRELLFRDLDVTLDDMECTCEYELKDDELERVQSRLKQNRPIEADIEKMVLVKYSFTVSYQGQSGSDEKLALAYSFGDGNWYTMGSRPAIVRAAILSDCEQ